MIYKKENTAFIDRKVCRLHKNDTFVRVIITLSIKQRETKTRNRSKTLSLNNLNLNKAQLIIFTKDFLIS